MLVRTLIGTSGSPARVIESSTAEVPQDGWRWVDIELQDDTPRAELDAAIVSFDLDELALDDAFADFDLPKVDDFGDHLLIVLHGLSDSAVATYELDCFLTDSTLVTVHRGSSPALSAFSTHAQRSRELTAGSASDLLARLADVVARRYLVLVDHLDERLEQLTELALNADPQFLELLTDFRSEMQPIRSILRPQREAFDQLRSSESPLVADTAQRRFSDVYDIGDRAVNEFEAARVRMNDALGAYQGAEARQATAITKVLTIYAAIMLPLSLIAGFFGMNFTNLPGGSDDSGWMWALILMLAVAIGSMAVFVIVGWLRPASPRALTRAASRSMVEVLRTPAHIAGGLYRDRVKPLRGRSR